MLFNNKITTNFTITNLKQTAILLSNYLVVLFAFLMPFRPYLGKKVLILLFLIWIFTVDYKKLLTTIKKNLFLIALILFILFNFLSFFWTQNTTLAMRLNENLLIYVFLPILIFFTIIEKRFVPIIIFAFLSSMFFNMVFSYLMYFELTNNIFGIPFWGTKLDLVPYQVSHMSYSAYIAFSIFLLARYLLKSSSIFIKIFQILFLLSLIILLFLGTGRTGQIVLVLTSFILIFIYLRNNVKYILASLALLFLMLFGAYNTIDMFEKRVKKGIENIEKITQDQNYSSSFGVRVLSYTLMPELLKETNILIGSSFADSPDIVQEKQFKYLNQSFRNQKGQLHNTFLTAFISVGIIGFILLLSLFILILKSKIKESEIRYLKYFFLSTLVISCCSTELFGQKEFMFLFALFSSIIMLHEHKEMSL